MLCSHILKMLGWKISGQYPYHEKKLIIAAAPHTSNWDFPLGVLVRCHLKIKAKYVGKDSLFKPPLGWIIKRLGGIPVDRSKSNNFVDGVVSIFERREALTVAFAPEGTRKKVSKFKTGYYYVAKRAKIPIQPMVLDYASKEISFLPLFWPTTDEESDLQFLENLFIGIRGCNPEKSFKLTEES